MILCGKIWDKIHPQVFVEQFRRLLLGTLRRPVRRWIVHSDSESILRELVAYRLRLGCLSKKWMSCSWSSEMVPRHGCDRNRLRKFMAFIRLPTKLTKKSILTAAARFREFVRWQRFRDVVSIRQHSLISNYRFWLRSLHNSIFRPPVVVWQSNSAIHEEHNHEVLLELCPPDDH